MTMRGGHRWSAIYLQFIVVIVGLHVAYASMPPQLGGTLRVVFAAEVSVPDPETAWSFEDWMLARQVHAGLYRVVNGRPVPDLASGLPQKTAPGTYQIAVHPEATFHDGRSVTSADVERMWTRVRPDGLSLRVTGAKTVQVSTAKGVSSVAVAKALGQPLSVITGARPYIGAGPFVYRRADGKIRLEAYMTHHRGRPWLDEVVISHGVGSARAIEEFIYKRAELIFESAMNERLAQVSAGAVRRLEGPVRQMMGVFPLTNASASEAAILSQYIPRKPMARRLGPNTSSTGQPTPFDTDGRVTEKASGAVPAFRWYVATASALKQLVYEMALPFGKSGTTWPVQLRTGPALRDVITGRLSSSCSAVLMGWYYAASYRESALKLLKRAQAVRGMVPVAQRSQTAFYRSGVYQLQWDSTGLLDLADVWRR